MKTTKLMTAFALSTMFAACSQDAELNEAIAKNDFSNIPMVEANFTINSGVESRMQSGWGWELNDKVGFAWLGTGTMIDGNAYQNNPLYCIDEDGAFKAEGMFYVGKYFAYIPYTEGTHNIEAINFDVTGQPLSSNVQDLAKHAIYISPKVYELEKKTGANTDDANKLASGIGKNLPLNIAQVSNAATINLTFGNVNNMTDLKVYSVSLDAKVGTSSVLPTSFTYHPMASAPVTNDSWKGYSAYSFYTATTPTTGAIVAETEDGLSVSNGALTIYMLTMPRKSGEDINAFEVKLVTNYGNVTVDLNSVVGTTSTKCITFTEKDNNGVVQNKTITTTSLFNTLGSTGTINVYVDMDEKEMSVEPVKNLEELNAALTLLETAGYNKPITITVNPETANAANNFELADFELPENLKSVVTLETGAKATNGFLFTGNSTIDKQIKFNSPVAVAEDATLTVEYLVDETDTALKTLTMNTGKTLTVNNEGTLVNNGHIVGDITTVAATTGTNAKGAGKYISNNEYTRAAWGTFTNNGEIQWIAGQLPTVTGIIYAEVNNLMEMQLAGNAGVTTARFMNDVEFSNKKNNVTIENIATVEIYGNVTMNIEKFEFDGKAAKVKWNDVTAINLMSGASFTIDSDLEDNQFHVATGTVITTETESNLTISNVKVYYVATINFAGNVDIAGATFNTTPDLQVLPGGKLN